MVFRFGDFAFFCQKVALPLCTALSLDDPKCYSRNVEVAGFLIFEPCKLNSLDVHVAAAFIDIIALGMTAIMIYNIKSKYTAVGKVTGYLIFREKGNCPLLLSLFH